MELSRAAFKNRDADQLILLFCQQTRRLFDARGAYFWKRTSEGDLVGTQADGLNAERFRGLRVRAGDQAVVLEAVQTRRTTFHNGLDRRCPKLAHYPATSEISSPVIVSNEIVGAISLLHDGVDSCFDEHSAAKTTILATQLGTALESIRLNRLSREERRWAMILGEAATSLHGLADTSAIIEGIADRVRVLLHSPVVLIFVQEGKFHLRAVSSETPALERVIRSRSETNQLRSATEIAARAVAASKRITVSIDGISHFGKDSPSGVLIASPFRTSRADGAIVVYPRSNSPFAQEEKTLVSAIAGFGAVAIANAELYGIARAQAQQQHQILELNTDLRLPGFTRDFALRASGLFGGRAAALSLFEVFEHNTLLLCDGSEVGDKLLLRRLNQALRATHVEYSEDVVFVPAKELLGTALASDLGWTDCTLVRLAGVSGEPIGVLCLANRGAAPSAEDLELMRAVARHGSVALENACRLTRMEQDNSHWIEVFNAISDFIVVHDQQQTILRVNRSLADLVGIAPDRLIGAHMRAFDALSSGDSPPSCPFCRISDGSGDYLHSALERTYLISTSRLHADSAQLQTVHVLKDMTDRLEAERRYRELFDNIQEGIFFSTPEGRFVEVNDALVRILGYDSREEVLQLDIPSQVYFSSQRRAELSALLEQQGGLRNQEEILRRKDGSPVHVYINCFALRDSRGQVLQYRGLMLDVTRLHNSQIDLQRERDFSSKILDHTQSLILVTGTEGVISYANRRWGGLGFQPAQLLGHSFPELAAPARRQALLAALAEVARGQQIDNFDLSLVRPDSVSGQFSVNLSPIRAEDGSVSSIVVVMTDVTDATVLQAKLVHTEKLAAVGQLVSGVAHEVNNPLTAILGFADLLIERPDLPESARRDLRVILQEAQRTKQIVQNLLSFARQMPPQRLLVQLNSILRRTLRLRAYDFHSHGIEVVERLDESLPEVLGDSHQLQQVFLNIVNNAYDAVRETGRRAHIEIMSARSGSWIEVSFRDNGVGIGEPDRIFDPFFTTKEVGKGTGLGLSICYGIVHEHGGEIIGHNNRDSEGATFIVRLPVPSQAASLEAIAGVYPK